MTTAQLNPPIPVLNRIRNSSKDHKHRWGLYDANYFLINEIVQKYGDFGVPKDELTTVAVRAYLFSVISFNASKKSPFSIYAAWNIKHAVCEEIIKRRPMK